MPRFPVGTGPSADMGDHVMGVVVLAWLSGYAFERWGPEWAGSGGLDARFRAHLSAGLELVAEISDADGSLGATITDADEVIYATATVTGPDASASRHAPHLGSVDEPEWHPLTFEFDAGRDLAFTAGLADGEVWRRPGWAHPAWLASASNALVLRNVEFAGGDVWKNAGLAVIRHRPITDGATITLTGRVAERFDSSRYRFAVAAVTAWVTDQPVATLRNTFTYATRQG
jgi:hypothetical protein